MLASSCELCDRQGMRLTRHHLIPRKMHNKARIRKRFSREVCRTRVAMLCSDCHHQVHAVLSEKELADEWNELGRLREHPELARFVAWISRRGPSGRVRSRRRRDRA